MSKQTKLDVVPECDREHLPEGHVSVDFRAISSASLAWFVNVPSGRALLQIGDAARAELARRLGDTARAELARRDES